MKGVWSTGTCVCVCVRVCVCVCVLINHVWLFEAPWTVSHETPLSMGFSRQEYWSGVAIFLQVIFLTAWQVDSLPSGKPLSLLDEYKHWVNVCRDRDASWFFFNWQRVKILGLKESRDCQRAISPPSEIFHSLPTWMTNSLQDPGAYPKHPLPLPSVIIHTYLLIKPERKVHHLCTNSTFVLSLKHSFLENIYWHLKESWL